MTTCLDLVERTRRHLYTETRDEVNRLTSSMDGSTTTLAFDFDPGGIATGAILSVDLEEMRVWSVSSGSAVVERGVNGTTAASHTSGVTIRVNPKVSTFQIFQAINEDLLDLSSPDNGLYRVRTVDLSYDGSADAYDLTSVSDLIGIVDVTFDANDGTSVWKSIRPTDWNLKRSLPTSSFPSGMALTLYQSAEPGRQINVVYKSGFTQFAALTDNLTTTGLAATMADIPPLGAAVRIIAGGEVARNFLDQGETRRANEVPAGARAASIRNLVALRSQRIEAEAARLTAQYPVTR